MPAPHPVQVWEAAGALPRSGAATPLHQGKAAAALLVCSLLGHLQVEGGLNVSRSEQP